VSNRTIIIAEAGVNHNGDIELAKNLVSAAADAGADLVKFQTFRADRLVTQAAPKAEYQKNLTDSAQSQFAMLRQLELSNQMHETLIAHCQACGIGFLSTAFDIESLDYLASLGIVTFKVSSGEITNLPYLRHIGAFDKSIILSSGMATLGEIESALEVIENAGTGREKITVLHCNTEYPTPVQEVCLLAMCSIREALNVATGYSDHTLGVEVPIAAVALGATVLEKHLTLDRNLPGPDHKSSLEPDEFAAMVKAIRNTELALGDGIKRPSLSEIKNKNIVRKSLVAAKSIRKGQVFSPDNVTAKRPGFGISPMRWDEVMGRVAKKDYLVDELIDL
jgi:N,N'-diacetyllegionaminate synthase